MDAAQPALVSHQTNLDQDHARAQGATFVDKPSLAPSCPPPSPLDAYLLPGTTTFSRDRNGKVKGHICASLVRRLKRHSSEPRPPGNHEQSQTPRRRQRLSLASDVSNELQATPTRHRLTSVSSWHEPSKGQSTCPYTGSATDRPASLRIRHELDETVKDTAPGSGPLWTSSRLAPSLPVRRVVVAGRTVTSTTGFFQA